MFLISGHPRICPYGGPLPEATSTESDCRILPDLVGLGRIRWDLDGFGRIRLDSVEFGRIWSDLV